MARVRFAGVAAIAVVLLAASPARAASGTPIPPRMEPILLKAGTLKGIVKDYAGKPLSNTSIELLDAGGKSVAKTITNARGEYLFRDIAPGRYTALVGGRTRLPITMTTEATVSRLVIVPSTAATGPMPVAAAAQGTAGPSEGFLGLSTWTWVAIGGGVAVAVAIPIAASGGGGGGGGGPVSP
jgi:hypothetical protein